MLKLKVEWTSRNWDDESTHVFFNPRMPSTETSEIQARLRALKPLSGHFWLATSGSTAQVAGQLKWVALSKKAILVSARAVNQHLFVAEQDRWIHALPDFHVGGIGIFARAHLSNSAVVDGLNISRQWEARWFYQRCHDSSATLSALVPAQIFDLVQLGLQAPPSLRAIVIGGGALSESLYLHARRLGWPVLPSYGLTECCSQVATADMQSLQVVKPTGSPALHLLSHVEATTAPDGRLRLRSEALLSGYALLTSDLTQDRLMDRWIDPCEQGWFQAEDLGSASQGKLTVQGRTSDFVKIGGESVDLNRLERVLEEVRTTQYATFDITLLVVPDERLGHVIHAAVAVSENSSAAQNAQAIFRAFDQRVLPYERVRAIHFVDQIPRSPLRKLLRAELLAQLTPKLSENR